MGRRQRREPRAGAGPALGSPSRRLRSSLTALGMEAAAAPGASLGQTPAQMGDPGAQL